MPSTVLQPARIWPSPYGSAAFAGATVRRRSATSRRASALLGTPGLHLPLLGRDRRRRPPARAVERRVRRGGAARRWTRSSRAAEDTLVLITADHGQIDVDPTGSTSSTSIWPELPSTCAAAPAPGSARDCFLHVDEPEHVVAELRDAARRPRRGAPRARAVRRRRAARWTHGSATSASSPRPAGWPGCARSRATSAASAATTAGSPPDGVGDLGRRSIDVMETGFALRHARPRHGGALRLAPARARGDDASASTRSCCAPGQRGRIHRHTEQEEVYLVLSGTLTLWIEGERHELGQGELARVAPERPPPDRQPRTARTSC